MENRKITGILVLFAVCVLSVTCMIMVLCKKKAFSEIAFVPPEFDRDAKSGTPNPPEEAKYEIVDVTAYRFGICGQAICLEGKVFIFMTNDADNQVWLKARILDSSGTMLGESGLIRPGEYVEAVALTSLPKIPSMIKIKVMSYEIDTYHSMGSAVMNVQMIMK